MRNLSADDCRLALDTAGAVVRALAELEERLVGTILEPAVARVRADCLFLRCQLERGSGIQREREQ